MALSQKLFGYPFAHLTGRSCYQISLIVLHDEVLCFVMFPIKSRGRHCDQYPRFAPGLSREDRGNQEISARGGSTKRHLHSHREGLGLNPCSICIFQMERKTRSALDSASVPPVFEETQSQPREVQQTRAGLGSSSKLPFHKCDSP